MVTRVLGFIIVWQIITAVVWITEGDLYKIDHGTKKAVVLVELAALLGLFMLAGIVVGCWLMFRGLL